MGSYFEVEKTDIIRMPHSGIRNDCSKGTNFLGPIDVGPKINASVLETKELYGPLGKTEPTDWLQIWFIPEIGSSEDIPLKKLLVTYIKKESLQNYRNNEDRVIRGIEKGEYKNPADPVYTTTFIPKMGIAPYFVLGWKIRKRTDKDNSLEELAAFYKKNHERFIDSRESSPSFKRVQD